MRGCHLPGPKWANTSRAIAATLQNFMKTRIRHKPVFSKDPIQGTQPYFNQKHLMIVIALCDGVYEPIMNFLEIWLALSVVTVIFLCRLFAVSGPPQQR